MRSCLRQDGAWRQAEGAQCCVARERGSRIQETQVAGKCYQMRPSRHCRWCIEVGGLIVVGIGQDAPCRKSATLRFDEQQHLHLRRPSATFRKPSTTPPASSTLELLDALWQHDWHDAFWLSRATPNLPSKPWKVRQSWAWSSSSLWRQPGTRRKWPLQPSVASDLREFCRNLPF